MDKFTRYLISALLFSCVFIIPLFQAHADRYDETEYLDYLHELDALYPILLTEDRTQEEWPSEKWNFQDNYGHTVRKVHAKSNPKIENEVSTDESEESMMEITQEHIKEIFTSVKGIGNKKVDEMMEKLDSTELIEILESAPEKFTKEFSWFKKKMLTQLDEVWTAFKNKL